MMQRDGNVFSGRRDLFFFLFEGTDCVSLAAVPCGETPAIWSGQWESVL